MKKLILFIVLISICFCTEALADWRPAGFQKWQDSANPKQFQQRIGGEMVNYQRDDSTWAVIQNDWMVTGDTIENLTDILKTTVRPKGTSIVKVRWNGVDYTVTQKLVKLIWLKTDTWDWVGVTDSATWAAPSVDSNIITWQNVFPAVDYRIRKSNASVAHGIFFKKAFLDSAVALYNKRADSLAIALGNVMEYSLVNVDNAEVAIGNVDERILKQLGHYVFELSRQMVNFPGSDTLPELPVKQRWI